ncbi:hypothetical protein AKJ16_DCAP24976 [Drosera capensis]
MVSSPPPFYVLRCCLLIFLTDMRIAFDALKSGFCGIGQSFLLSSRPSSLLRAVNGKGGLNHQDPLA